MNTAHKSGRTDQQTSLKQRIQTSRRSADRIMQIAPNALQKAALTTCAAAKLGDLLEKAWIARDEIEEVANDANRSTLEPLELFCSHRIDELELAISYTRAASPAGMLAQLAVAFDAVDLAVTASEKVIREAASTRAERCLHSVAAALLTLTGTEREGSCVNRYMPAIGDGLAFISPEVVG